MLPGFMRRLLRKHEAIAAREDAKPPSDGESSFFVQEFAAVNTEALGVLLTRYQDVMNGAGLRLTQCYRKLGILIEADDALSGTLFRMLADSLKRGGPGRAPRTITIEETVDELPCMIRRLGAETLDELVDHAPGPEDLALARPTVEALIEHLNSPFMTKIVSMRIDQYSIEEISEGVGVAIRTVERGLSEVREASLEPAGHVLRAWA